MSIHSFLLALTVGLSLSFPPTASADEFSDALDAWLSDVPKDAPVVAIGESVHASAGVQHVQNEMFKKLILERGVRIIVKESGALASESFDEWLKSCRTKVTRPTLEGLYWKTEEDFAFARWLCTYNFEHANDPVYLRNIDIWDSPWTWFLRLEKIGAAHPALAIEEELKSLGTDCPGLAARTPDDEAAVRTYAREHKQFDSPAIEACFTAHARANAKLEAMIANPTVTEEDRYEFYWGLIALSSSQGWHEAWHKRFRVETEGWNGRDAAQGRNAQLIRRQLGLDKKVGWIAHTSHTSHNRSSAQWWGVGDVRSGVFFFELHTGVKVFNTALIGYDFTEGTYVCTKPTAPNSIEKLLHDRGAKFAYLPTRSNFFRGSDLWWMQNENDPTENPDGVLIRPSDHFDGYFYLEQSLGAKDIPGADLPPYSARNFTLLD